MGFRSCQIRFVGGENDDFLSTEACMIFSSRCVQWKVKGSRLRSFKILYFVYLFVKILKFSCSFSTFCILVCRLMMLKFSLSS